MSVLNLFANLDTRKLVSPNGGTAVLPQLVLGDVPRFTLATFSGQAEKFLFVRSLTASIGKNTAAPESGSFKLRVAGVLSSAITFDETAGAILTKLGAPAVSATKGDDGCWVVRFDGGAPLTVLAAPDTDAGYNTLSPRSFVRVRPFQENGIWFHEIRLLQTPLAWNDAGHERVLPDPPSVTEIRAGAAATDTAPAVNELQDLLMPPGFRGTYFFRWNFRASPILGEQDGPDAMAVALNAMFTDSGNTRFAVTNPADDHAYIEFIGGLAGAPQPLITIEVHTFPPGVLTFDVPLDHAELCTALRSEKTLTVPLEIELEVCDSAADLAGGVPGRVITLAQQPVTIVREQMYAELAVVREINWLRPPSPRNYIAFDPSQILTGEQHWVGVIGDGTAAEYSIAHGLGTEAIAGVAIRENGSGGRMLIPGTDYTFTIESGNEIVITFAAVPALNSLAVVITAAGPVDVFQAHTHLMAQITGLLDALAELGARLAVVEAYIPTNNPAAPSGSSTGSMTIVIPDAYAVFPGRLPAGFNPAALITPATVLPRSAGLLPAIHDATVVDITIPLPDVAASAGNVFLNNTGAAIIVPGGLGRRSSTLAAGGFLGSDGRVWYRLTRSGSTKSWFPTEFEYALFPPIEINPSMLRAGTKLTVEFDVVLQLLQAATEAQYMFVIEIGAQPSQTSPATTSTNLEDIVWNTTPLLSQRLICGRLKRTHRFGAAILRAIDGTTFSSNQLVYSAWLASAVVPADANFALRARLINFDTENSIANTRGNVLAGVTGATAGITT